MASPRIVLITGANAGLGLEIVRALAGSSKPYTILVAGRSSDKVAAAIKTVQGEHPSTASTFEPVQIDVESHESIFAAVAQVEKQFGHVDVLINNAGAQHDHDASLTKRQVMLKNWDVNVAGTHVLTDAVAPLLAKSTASPQLVFMTSGTASLTQSTNAEQWFNASPPAGFPKQGPNLTAYRSVKVGLNMLMREWARILKNDNVQVYSVSPGFLATGLGINDAERLKAMGALDPKLGGELLRDLVEGKHERDVGKVVHRDGPQPW